MPIPFSANQNQNQNTNLNLNPPVTIEELRSIQGFLYSESIISMPNSNSNSTNNRRTVTTADLKNKSCWICSEDEVENDTTTQPEPEAGPSSRPDQADRGRGGDGKTAGNSLSTAHGFVHPCHCTLVAHEKCLLKWIAVERSKSTRLPNSNILCPSCKSPIILTNPKPFLLKSFELLDYLTGYFIPIGTMSVIGSGILVASTAYGCLAIRLVMGKDAGRRILGGDWPLHFYFDIPLIPFALIASRLRFFEKAVAWIPTVLAFPAAHLPLTSNRNTVIIGGNGSNWTILGSLGRGGINSTLGGRRYPPSPAILALLIPWIRVFYMGFKRRVTRFVLGKFLKKKKDRRNNGPNSTTNQRNENENGNGNNGGGGRRRRRERYIIVGNAEANNMNVLRDGDDLEDEDEIDPPPGIEALRNGRPEDQEIQPENENQDQGRNPNPNPNAQEGEAAEEEGEEERPQTIYISHQSLGRLCLGALSLPFVANLSGSLLGKLATKSRWLSKFLGMNWEEIVSQRFSPSSGSGSSKNGPSSGRIGAMFSGGSNSSNAAKLRMKQIGDSNGIYSESWMGDFDDLDPVWYRNALGAGLFILFKDAGSLLFKYLELRQRGRERVKDLPFDQGLIAGLDLREGVVDRDSSR